MTYNPFSLYAMLWRIRNEEVQHEKINKSIAIKDDWRTG